MRVITGGRIFTGEEFVEGKSIVIEDGIITDIASGVNPGRADEIVDASGMTVAPGFIDLQIAGAGGYLFSSNLNGAALKKICDAIVRSGTTGFLVVLPTNSADVYRKAIETVQNNPHGALLGLHLEGPFINPAKKGAHAEHYIRKCDDEEINSLLESSGGSVKMLTLAPEMSRHEVIVKLLKSVPVLCAGHSSATFEEAMTGFGLGIKAVTHLYNAMSSFHHRETGLPGAAFLSGNVMASIVADGIHVSYEALSAAKAIMGERLYLVSDAVEESDDPACRHIRRADRFTLPDGTLSGSALTMMKAVENCVRHAGIDPGEALRMASLYPARLMGLGNAGMIKPGYRANITVFDNDYTVRTVLLDGTVTGQ